MRLRPRQKTFVERSLAALDFHGNTLGIAPTGAGKTIMLSAVTGEVIGDSAAKACVLARAGGGADGVGTGGDDRGSRSAGARHDAEGAGSQIGRAHV